MQETKKVLGHSSLAVSLNYLIGLEVSECKSSAKSVLI